MKVCDLGYTISTTLILVFFGFRMLESHYDQQLSDLGTGTTSPATIGSKIERLRRELDAGTHSTPLDTISKSDLWESFEYEMSDYADRLELLEEQRRSRSRLLFSLLWPAVILMAVFTYAGMILKLRKTLSESSSGD